MMDDTNIVSSLLDGLEDVIDTMTFEQLEVVCYAASLDIQLLKEMYYENPSNRRGLC